MAEAVVIEEEILASFVYLYSSPVQIIMMSGNLAASDHWGNTVIVRIQFTLLQFSKLTMSINERAAGNHNPSSYRFVRTIPIVKLLTIMLLITKTTTTLTYQHNQNDEKNKQQNNPQFYILPAHLALHSVCSHTEFNCRRSQIV